MSAKKREYKQKLQFIPTKSDGDLAEVYNYDVEVFTDSPDFSWTLQSLKDEVLDGWQIYSVKLDDEIVAAAFIKEGEHSLLTKNTPIKIVYQGNGFSHQIKEFFESEAKNRKADKVYHYCSSHNFRFISLNENHGYDRTEKKFEDNKFLTEWVKDLK